MSEVKSDLYFSPDHEWARLEDGDAGGDRIVVIGITDYAQEHLGDVVMVEVPEVGEDVQRGEAFGSVESPKSVSDLMSPVTGEVLAVNEALEDEPETVNEDCYGDGWIIKVEVSAEEAASLVAELMDPDAYAAHLAELEDA